ncbi:hypothetical protein L7F22_065634 [Adiantum nelumboides]|nr:hypothetical protein [Adiantum nelumboides]
MVKIRRQIPIEAKSENLSKAQLIETVVERWFEDEPGIMVESNIKQVHFNEEVEEIIPKSYFSRAHWARATSKIVVRIRDFDESVVALMDSSCKINIKPRSLHVKGNCHIDTEPRWSVKATNTAPRDLHGVCPSVKVTIGDVSDEHIFCVQEYSSCPLILGQPFIIVIRMETKVLDDGSTCARIRSKDGKKAVQFLIICVNHGRNMEKLREYLLPRDTKEFKEFRGFSNFLGILL